MVYPLAAFSQTTAKNTYQTRQIQNKYKPLINKVLSGKELNGAELSEFIQVQKNFYYDQNYDNSSNIFAPRQIKNAEFVLVPQLIAGTQLEVVAKLMDTSLILKKLVKQVKLIL